MKDLELVSVHLLEPGGVACQRLRLRLPQCGIGDVTDGTHVFHFRHQISRE